MVPTMDSQTASLMVSSMVLLMAMNSVQSMASNMDLRMPQWMVSSMAHSTAKNSVQRMEYWKVRYSGCSRDCWMDLRTELDGALDDSLEGDELGLADGELGGNSR